MDKLTNLGMAKLFQLADLHVPLLNNVYFCGITLCSRIDFVTL